MRSVASLVADGGVLSKRTIAALSKVCPQYSEGFLNQFFAVDGGCFLGRKVFQDDQDHTNATQK
jgi:hypothetical protein